MPNLDLDHVKEVYSHWVKGNRDDCSATIVYADGESESFKGFSAYSTSQQLDVIVSPVVAAAPGFYLLGFWFQEDVDIEPTVEVVFDPIWREPIVAWRIVRGSAEPIGIDDDPPPSGGGGTAILRPDGVVTSPYDQSWKTIDDWAAGVRDDWKEWREMKCKQASKDLIAADNSF
jgi:hypothetical protein